MSTLRYWRREGRSQPVTHFGVHDAASGGNLLIYGALNTGRMVAVGDSARFLANAFLLTAD